MAKARTRRPLLRAFGLRLSELRAGRSRQQISLWLRNKYGVELAESSYFQYEKGTVWAPDVGVLKALSDLYGVPFEELTGLVLANRQNTATEDWRSLIGPSNGEQSPAAASTVADIEPQSTTVRRAVRLLNQMTDEGQRLAAQNIALLVPAFRRQPRPGSAAQSEQRFEGRARKARGTR